MLKKTTIILGLLSLALSAGAKEWDYYFEYKAKVSLSKEKKAFLNLKEETRYNDGINYYRKTSLGLSKKFNSGEEISFYHAFEDKKKVSWHTFHMFWAQFDYENDLKVFSLASSTKLERHCSQNSYTFREEIKFIFPVNKKLNFWFGDEGRIFSLFNNSYFGENEILCGFDSKLRKDFSINVYYDLREIKNKGVWDNANCLRTVLNLKL